MEWNQVEGKWTSIKGKVKEKWSALTDDDITRIEGKKDQLVGTLQQRYGMAKEKAEREAEDFASALSS